MAKGRKSSGFFETVIKSLCGSGTTVHRSRNWLGQNVTKVVHHDTGKTKTYTHGTGLFGTSTRTVTKKGGKVVEQGKLKKTFFLGTPVEQAKKMDGSGRTVKRVYGQGIFGNKMKTKTYGSSGREVGSGETNPSFFLGTTKSHYVGECYCCNGSGSKTVTCRSCSGSGTFVGQCKTCAGTGVLQSRALACRTCNGSGQVRRKSCRRCGGAGQWIAPEVTCKRCGGTGGFSAQCKRCDGEGCITHTCRKCNGSGKFCKGS